MKKTLYMLLFMAVALFSAATMVSCGDDDDEIISLTDKYTITFEVNTSDPKVKDTEAYKVFIANMQTKLQKLTEMEFYLSDLQAKSEWLTIEMTLKNDTDIQNKLNALAKALDDTTLSCSLKMLKNGKDWKSLEWKTWYNGY